MAPPRAPQQAAEPLPKATLRLTSCSLQRPGTPRSSGSLVERIRGGSLLASLPRARGAPDRRLDPVVRHAATECFRHRLADLCVVGSGVPIEKSFRRQNLPVLTETALRHLLVDPRLLQGMQHAVDQKPFERRDLRITDRRDPPHARSHGLAADDDGAGSALPESAAEPRSVKIEVVPENVKKR